MKNTDRTGHPWKCASTGDLIEGRRYQLRYGTASPSVGPRWLLDWKGEGDWSTVSPLGSKASVEWEPARSELTAQLAEWMLENHAARLVTLFVSDFRDVLA